jgi:hypothetical protein
MIATVVAQATSEQPTTADIYTIATAGTPAPLETIGAEENQ